MTNGTAGRFTAELWHGIGDVYRAILAHPFLAGLADGTLPADAFEYYLVQDALYLRQYARALAVVAGRAPDPSASAMFARHAADAIAVERTLHDSLLADLGVAAADAAAAEMAPTTRAYTDYLLATAYSGSYAEGVGAVLPCYWIYQEVGGHLLRRGSPDPRYRRWIDTYGGDEFAAAVREVLAVADTLGAGLAADERARVQRNFRVASRYEWMFWEMGYRRETWPL